MASHPDYSSVSAFGARLLPGETLLWSGRPGQGLRLTARDALLIPFSLMFCGFAVFWEASVFGTTAPVFFRLWGVPFVLAGLYILVGRFVFDAWLRRRTYYAVTDRRILVHREAPFATFIALNRDRLPDMQLTPGTGGTGTIRFGQPSQGFQRNGFAGWTPALDPTPQFIAIADAHTVFDNIQNLPRPVA